MFNRGDYIISINNEYSVTNKDTVCIVKNIEDSINVVVEVVASIHKSVIGDTYVVKKENFIKIENIKEFLTITRPDIVAMSREIKALLNTEGADEPTTEDLITFNYGEPYNFSDDEIKEVAERIREQIDSYDSYNTSYSGCLEIAKEWARNKAALIGAMKKNPKYNGNYQIVFDMDVERNVDKETIKTIISDLKNCAFSAIVKGIKISPWAYHEIISLEDRCTSIYNILFKLYNYGIMSCVDELNKYKIEKDKFTNIHNKYLSEAKIIYGNAYNIESYNRYERCKAALDIFYAIYNQYLTAEQAERINTYSNVNAKEGQKTSKAFMKVCKEYELDKLENFDSYYRVKYSDAINPFVVKKYTILSANPLDYLTMSNGTNWSSCHNPDKNRDSYHGCYMSGTISYMLDETSLVFYTLDAGLSGENPEIHPKEMRQMFHVGEDKIIQGRLYPYDQTDRGRSTEPEEYTQYRNTVQKIIADIMEVNNLWKFSRGTEACTDASSARGTHYRDISHYSNCNVSKIKYGKRRENKMYIGHNPICPDCGETHNREDNLNCEACDYEQRYCEDCGCTLYDGEGYETRDGEWYCSDCSFYCSYHDEYERGRECDQIYVENYGYICGDALEYGDFYTCDECGSVYLEDAEAIYTSDGYIFCSEYCAISNGYVYDEEANEWVIREE